MTPEGKIVLGGTLLGMALFGFVGARIGGFRGMILGAIVAGIGGGMALGEVQ